MARRAKKGEGAFIWQCRTLAEHWDTIDPAAIGLSEQFVGSFDEKTQAARDAAAAVLAARDALASALLRKRIVMGALRASFGAATGQIDAHAKATGDPAVYPTARIAPPEKPGKKPSPPTPRLERVRTLGYGPIELRFTPCGERVFYDVQRSVKPLEGPQTLWEHVTSTGHQRVRDRRVPRGVAAVLYRVRARRTSGRASAWSSPVTVEFGCRAGEEVGAAPRPSASSGRGVA
jgi:hypothetical protein